MSGSPGLGGTAPTSSSGLANQNGSHGITGSQSGVNTITAGDLASSVGSVLSHEFCMLKFVNTKGSKFEYGLSVRVDIILGLKHQVIVGPKTTLDIAWNRTYDSLRYASLNAGFKYEVIAGKKAETIHGVKDDAVVGAKQIERVNGAWTRTDAAQIQKNQRLSQFSVDDLLQQFGAELNRTTTKYESDINALDLKAGKLFEACSAKLEESCKQYQASLTKLEENIEKIEINSKDFELKASQIDNAVSSALNIRTPSSKIKGSMIEIKATVQKFLADLVKLGE